MVHHKIMSVMGLCVCLIELRNCLTHWGRMMHICVGNLTIIVSDNGLSPYRRQAIIWTNAGILLIGPFSEIFIRIQTFSFKKMHLKMLSAKWRPFRLSLNVLRLMPLHTTCCNWDSLITSTVYWCIASKLKAPRNFYWMSNMFLWVDIFLFFVCYHVVSKRHSQLDYELNGLYNKMELKTTRWRCFLKIFTMTMSLESFDQLV